MRKAWALQCKRNDGSDFLAGYGFFKWERPEHMTGYVTATFETRRLAREAARTFGPDVKVVRVTVNVNAA